MVILSLALSLVVCVQNIGNVNQAKLCFSLCGFLSWYVAAKEVKQTYLQNIKTVK